MADNYLERRMEEHRNSQGARTVTRRSVLPAGKVTVDFPRRRVAVAGGLTIVGQAVIEAFRKMDCAVSFVAGDDDNMPSIENQSYRKGSLLAQRLGAQFHPGTTLEDLLVRLEVAGDPATVVVEVKEHIVKVTVDDHAPLSIINALTDDQNEPTASASAVSAASLAVMAASPAGAWTAGRTITVS